jgi:hypothetical protein
MPTFSSATCADRNSIQLGFSGAVTPDPTKVTVTTSGNGVSVAVTTAKAQTGGLVVDVHVEQGMSAGETYSVACTFTGVTGGPISVAVPSTALVSSPEWNHKPLQALTRGLGQVMQETSGFLSTILVEDFAFGDTRLVVESTLGWPSAGALWVAGRRMRFKALDPSGSVFLHVKDDLPDGLGIPKYSEVVCDVAAIIPD